jgi:hypothetical protein
MSEITKRREWKFPPSYDIGVHFYYHNLLAGSPYVQAFIRENIAAFDKSNSKLLDSFNAGTEPDSNMPRQMPYEALVAVLDDAGVGSKIQEQIKGHISHLAGGLGKPLDYLRVREFLAYCGIEGLFDFETKKHIKQEQKVQRIPPTIVPEKWRALPNAEEVRQDIAFMMDNMGRIQALEAQISALDKQVFDAFILDVTKDVHNTPLPADLEPLRQEYLSRNPDLAPHYAELNRLIALKASTLKEMKDQYAPLDRDFSLPELGQDFDKAWFDAGEELISRQRPFRAKFNKHMSDLGHKQGDPEYDSFDWESLRSRSFALWDWAYRDYTASPVNRGVLADARRGDFEDGFVRAVKEELQDGLLAALGLPYRIERVDASSDRYNIVCNDVVFEEFSLKQVYDLETSLIEKAEKAASSPKAGARKKPVKAVVSPQPAKDRPKKSPEQKEQERLEREQRILRTLQANGIDSEITVHDAKGVKTPAGMTVAPPADTPSSPESESVMSVVPEEAAQAAPPSTEAVETDVALPAPESSSKTPGAAAEAQMSESAPAESAGEEELLFPDAGVAGENGLDDHGNPVKPDAGEKGEKSVDATVIDFGNVTSASRPSAAPQPSKAAEQPATPKGPISPDADPVSAPAPDKKPPLTDRAKGASPYPERPKADPREAAARQMSSGYGGGGMGGMPRSGFSPQSMNIDLGFGHLVRGLSDVGRVMRNSLRLPGPNVFETTEAMNAVVNKIAGHRSILESGVDSAGAPLTEAAKISQWTEFKGDLDTLNGQVKTLKKVPRGSMEKETLTSFQKAARELTSAKDLAKSRSEDPGQIGELAREAQKVAEHVAKVLMNVVRAIMNVFSRSPSP